MQQLSSVLLLVVLIGVFYFAIIRPQNKQQKEIQKMRDAMKVGDEVLTIGGFYGIIYAIDDKNVVLEMLPDFNKAMVVKAAISRIITPEESQAENAAQAPTTESAPEEVVETETVETTEK